MSLLLRNQLSECRQEKYRQQYGDEYDFDRADVNKRESRQLEISNL